MSIVWFWRKQNSRQSLKHAYIYIQYIQYDAWCLLVHAHTRKIELSFTNKQQQWSMNNSLKSLSVFFFCSIAWLVKAKSIQFQNEDYPYYHYSICIFSCALSPDEWAIALNIFTMCVHWFSEKRFSAFFFFVCVGVWVSLKLWCCADKAIKRKINNFSCHELTLIFSFILCSMRICMWPPIDVRFHQNLVNPDGPHS